MLRRSCVVFFGVFYCAIIAGCVAPEMGDKSLGGSEATKLGKKTEKIVIPVNSIVPQRENSSDDHVRKSIITKYAYFEPSKFRSLPGWEEDQLTEAWQAFRQSCKALSNRSAWSKICARSTKIGPDNNSEIRAFIEVEFDLYQIFNTDRKSTGEITGYYEPIVNGSRTFGGPYTHPIYGVPDDLLFVDSRTISTQGAARPVWARVQGRVVKPVSATPKGQANLFKLELEGAQPDIRDKKIRVRVEGDRIVPYWTRAEIEQGGHFNAKILAWVDNPAAAYSMQVQGSGRVRFSNGRIMRLAYGEQNGRPFLPPVVPLTRGLHTVEVPLVRGFAIDHYEHEKVAINDTVPPNDVPLTRSGAITKPLDAQSASITSQQDMTPEVARMVEVLLPGKEPLRPNIIENKKPVLDAPKVKIEKKKSRKVQTDTTQPDKHLPKRLASVFWSDPSYVFFREIPDTGAGPIGALGVPLTAGRSLAVDPRTAPLGFPVFVATSAPGKGDALNRLMLAQDTGGAIRGAVRADYFWGVGASAFANASRMKESGRMWLLMPKELPLTGKIKDFRTRGFADIGDAECLVPDPELCVE